jgi:hypothetical protein
VLAVVGRALLALVRSCNGPALVGIVLSVRLGQRAGMSPERGEERTERSHVAGEFVLGNQPDARFRRARCCSLAADEAEAVLVDAAGAVAGGEEVQFVDHMVVAAYEGLIDPCPL